MSYNLVAELSVFFLQKNFKWSRVILLKVYHNKINQIPTEGCIVVLDFAKFKIMLK